MFLLSLPPDLLFHKEYTRLEKPAKTPVSTINFTSGTIPDHIPIREQPAIAQSETTNQSVDTPPDFNILPLGVNLGDRQVLPSSLIKGAEDGEQAVNFDQWLVSFNDVMKILGYQVKTLDDGQLELRSFAQVTLLDPKVLGTDPDLGLVFTVKQIRELLNVPVEFDIAEYALVFTPSWLTNPVDDRLYARKGRPIDLSGLPVIKAPNFTLTAIGEDTIVSGNNQDLNYQGNLSAVGTIFGGSWFLNIRQPQLQELNTWQLNELQYLRQKPQTDWVVGTHPTFWGGGNNFFGVSTVKRLGFEAPISLNSVGGGFEPNQRLQSSEIQRDIRGEAQPGSLVRLVTDLGNLIVDEVLVDSRGIYRFDNVSTRETSLIGGTNSNSYRILIYPNGDLTATPEIREANYSSLGDQLSKGTSAIIASVGVKRELSEGSAIGTFQDLTGGVKMRWGVTNNITLGLGTFYDQNWQGLADFAFQPDNSSLIIKGSMELGDENENLIYNARVDYDFSQDLKLTWNTDQLSQRVNLDWRILPELSIGSSWDSKDNAFSANLGVGGNFGEFYLSGNASINTNQNLRWNARSRWRGLELNYAQNESASNTTLNYNFSNSNYSSQGHSLRLGYNTSAQGDSNSLSASWLYTSGSRSSDNSSLWQFELGYTINNQNSGFLASVATNFIPNLTLSARYQNIPESQSSFTIQFSPRFYTHPRLARASSRFDRLRSEGGLFIQPFFDLNNNGKRDRGEKVFTEEFDLLFLLNNRPISYFGRYEAEKQAQGIFFRLPPNDYRFDVDPAGAPIGWQATQASSKVQVRPGAYTSIYVPLVPSYIVAGTISSSNGNPLGGVRVEAVSIEKTGKRVLSVTNAAGIYYLEGLQIGKYNLYLDGQLLENSTFEITSQQDPETIIELNFINSEVLDN